MPEIGKIKRTLIKENDDIGWVLIQDSIFDEDDVIQSIYSYNHNEEGNTYRMYSKKIFEYSSDGTLVTDSNYYYAVSTVTVSYVLYTYDRFNTLLEEKRFQGATESGSIDSINFSIESIYTYSYTDSSRIEINHFDAYDMDSTCNEIVFNDEGKVILEYSGCKGVERLMPYRGFSYNVETGLKEIVYLYEREQVFRLMPYSFYKYDVKNRVVLDSNINELSNEINRFYRVFTYTESGNGFTEIRYDFEHRIKYRRSEMWYYLD